MRKMGNPMIKEVLSDGTKKMREFNSPATLDDVVYYYRAGNKYTDRVNKKADIALFLAIISFGVSIVMMVLMLTK